jgi:hypothetical protein
MCDTPSQLRSTRSNNNNNSTSLSLTTTNSTTVSTFNCSILSLNCAKGKATTLEALHFASTHSNYNFVLLQEPHLNCHKLPPPLNNFQLFYPPPSPKSRLNCATYVPKSANLHPSVTFTHSTSFLGVTIKTPEHLLTIYNFYVMNPSPSGLRLSVERMEHLSIEVNRTSWLATMVTTVTVLLLLGWLLAFR